MQATPFSHDDLFFTTLRAATGAGPGEPVRLWHPFLCGAIEDLHLARELLERTARALPVPPTVVTTFAGADAWATSWHTQVGGELVEGVSAARRVDGAVDVTILVRSLDAVRPWRDAVRLQTAGLVRDDAWELPAGADRSLPPPASGDDDDAHLPFGLADDVVFHSPVLPRPVRGAARVTRVIAHAAAVYGPRTTGATLANGPVALNLWSAMMSSMPLHAATLVQFCAPQRASSIRVLFQPLPLAELFRDRASARAGDALTRELLAG